MNHTTSGCIISKLNTKKFNRNLEPYGNYVLLNKTDIWLKMESTQLFDEIRITSVYGVI